MAKRPSQPESLQPVAAVLAWILPGLGYVWFGQPLRALYVFIGIMGIFLGGLLVGGIDVVDRQEDQWWFILQAGVGPTTLGVNYLHQNTYKRPPMGFEDFDKYARKSVGRVNEMGSLYTSLAGMLNIIAIIDCCWHAPRRRREGSRKGDLL